MRPGLQGNDEQAPGAGEGGQTPVCDMRRVYRTLESQAGELGGMIENGVRYWCKGRFMMD